jgi:ABC-2 type transport system ATP-binding protein
MCRGVRRRTRRARLLDGVSFAVPARMRLLVVSRPEESASLLLRVLAGLARARGDVELAGLTDPSRDGWARRIAYVGPRSRLYGWMTPREILVLAAQLAESRASTDEIERLAAELRFGDALDVPISRGGPALEQRVELAAALLGDPEVLLLDEPLRALEPTERLGLLRLPGRRCTVVLASRYPASEAGLCSHVAYLADGRLALLGRLAELETAGLPLTHRGLEEFAVRRRRAQPSIGARQPLPAPAR